MRTALLALLAFLSFFPALHAQDTEDAALYLVTDVAADVTADSAAKARDQAILQAQRSAFEQLLTRLGADTSLAAKKDDTVIAALVQAFEVQREQRSPVRYIGTFTIQFKPASVRALLGKSGVTFHETRSAPLLILPILNKEGRAILWEDRTAWRAAWERASLKAGQVPLVLPGGDLDDIALLSTAEAMSGKPESLQALAHKYQADGAVIAILEDSAKDIRIELRRTDASGQSAGAEHLTLQPQRDREASLAEAVKQVRAAVERSLTTPSSTKPLPRGPATHLPVAVPIASLAQWNAIKNRLGKVSAITRLTVLALTRGRAEIELEFQGDIPQLQEALTPQGLTLERALDTGAWELREGVAE